MIADSEGKLQMLMEKLILECSRMGLRINKGKAEVKKLLCTGRTFSEIQCIWYSFELG